MTDTLAIAIVGGLVTVIQSALTIWSGKKTRSEGRKRGHALNDVRELVNGSNTEQKREIGALKDEVGRLNASVGAITPMTGNALDPVTLSHDQVVVTPETPK